MMADSCRQQRALLAEWALGRLQGLEADELVAHLAACPACGTEAGELTEVAAALRLADPARVTAGDIPQPPPELGATIRARIAEERVREQKSARRRRTVRSGLSAAAVLLVAVVVGVFGWWGDDDADDYVAVEAITTAEGTDASIAVNDYGWGASLHITASGLADDAVYEVWVEDRDGLRRSAGSFRGIADTEIRCTMASAARLYEAERFGIDGPDGDPIYRGRLAADERTAGP